MLNNHARFISGDQWAYPKFNIGSPWICSYWPSLEVCHYVAPLALLSKILKF